jgi:uroporphyrinogen decarboxylase
MMDSRALVQGLLTGGDYDRVGVFEHFWPETPGLWVEQGYPTETVVVDGKETQQPVAPHEHFGLDMYPCGGWFDRMPLRGYSETLEETDEWVVRRNGAGAAFKYWKKHSGTPEHIDFRLSSRAIWERDYRAPLLQLDMARLDAANNRRSLEAGRAAGRWTCFGHEFVWESMRETMGDVNMFQSLALDPGWIQDFNRVYTDFFKRHFQALFAETGLPDGIWLYEDLAYRSGLFASPAMLRELVLPYFQEMNAWFHGQGLPVVLHSCGNVTAGLPLIVEAGFDALNPLEIKAGCDPFVFAERYGNRLAFQGGLDVRILETNERDTIRRGVVDLVEGMKARAARYLFGSDHSITPRVTYDSYRYALDVYREHMML